MSSMGSSVRRLAWVLLLLLGIVSVLHAVAAANSVPTTRIDEDSFPITANALKPGRCSAISLTTLITGSGTFDGSGGNDLILGSAGADTIRGRAGDDCILAGDGNDAVQGNQGADILLGGDGNDALDGGQSNDELYGQGGDDSLSGAQGTDLCDGGPGTDTADGTCETSVEVP